MPESAPKAGPTSSAEALEEFSLAVADARAARKQRRLAERERQATLTPTFAGRMSTEAIDITTVTAQMSRRSQQEGLVRATADMASDTRRVISSLSANGAVSIEVFELVDEVWTRVGKVALAALS